ncbi:hypothetical protein ACFLSQ_07785 [Bacteroidota bacterium]
MRTIPIGKIILFLSLSGLLLVLSCRTGYRGERYAEDEAEIQQSIDDYEIKVSKSAYIPPDGSGPVAGLVEAENPDAVLTFSNVGERMFVENGKTVNFIYDGVDPDETYIMYESWENGYYLTLVRKDEKVNVVFNKMCQIYIVGNPSLTRIRIPENLKYEQVIWTPRHDGTWELRVGTTQRGCKSKSLDDLQKMRNKGYENKVPK